MNHELYLAPPRPMRNKKTGRFVKGHKPFNKGLHWDDYMSKKSQKRASVGLKNLHKRPKKRPDNIERFAKKVVAVLDDGRFRIFDSEQLASQWLGGSRENVGRCCRQNESDTILKKGFHKGTNNNDHRYNGVRFYFMTNDVWWDKTENV